MGICVCHDLSLQIACAVDHLQHGGNMCLYGWVGLTADCMQVRSMLPVSGICSWAARQ